MLGQQVPLGASNASAEPSKALGRLPKRQRKNGDEPLTHYKELHHPESIPEICFPRHSYHPGGWLPNIFNYFYFAVLTSNTLGPPEDHSPAGQNARVVVLLHSSLMLIVLVIFVSRAINTLS
jgi:hypothetical protein